MSLSAQKYYLVLVLITGQSLVRYKQHLSNRSRSVKKPKCCSLPSCPQASLATCCSKGTFFNTALDCITAVCKTPCTNKEMGVAATLHPSGRVMERQCLLSTHGHRVLHWKSRARSPACCKYPVYLFSEGTVLLIFCYCSSKTNILKTSFVSGRS